MNGEATGAGGAQVRLNAIATNTSQALFWQQEGDLITVEWTRFRGQSIQGIYRDPDFRGRGSYIGRMAGATGVSPGLCPPIARTSKFGRSRRRS